MISIFASHGAGRLARTLTAVGAVFIAATACYDAGKILDQDAPSRVTATDLDNPNYAQLLVNSAIGDFECAFTQYIVATGLVGDELIDAQLSQAGWDYDRRTIFPASGPYSLFQCGQTQVPALYTPLAVARFDADKILKELQGWTDAQVANRQSLIATAAVYAGYSLELLGEAMCSGAIDLGPEMMRQQLFAAAEARFTTAITAATGTNPTMLKAAYVGRARARLNQNNLTGAGADAALVTDSTFVLSASYSATATRRENMVWSQMYRGLFSSVDPSYRGLTFGGVADPRVTVVDAGVKGQDSNTEIWRQTKYTTISSSIPIARYAEAQLILAEADNAANNTAAAVNIINALHAKAGIPAYAGGTQDEVQTQIIEERRRELFLEGQRFGDLIRYNIAIQPAPGAPFPVKGGSYGPNTGLQLCFPLPDVERNNNPNIGKTS
ncbi:MAG TPA: RagB/SusD family nutrient uptake outer membrane protein [Gemmatimonadaceae bacterium]|nr:RagB/SusD family nutrient uptake outer membrane protein [Gemmatimonadaceae bacterium]